MFLFILSISVLVTNKSFRCSRDFGEKIVAKETVLSS